MQRSQRTVLIIDDEPADRLTYRRYLATDPLYEYTVLEAEHGGQALALCGATQPDCIILDYRLPDEDGLTVLERLAAAAHPHLYPVVMLTGMENTAIAVQAMQRGVHDYLSKQQVTPDQLQRAVSNAIEKVALQGALAQQREWFRIALTSIGDAVIATDTAGRVTFLNPVAETLTGWSLAAAQGQPLAQVFHIVSEETRQVTENPVVKVLAHGAIVGLANHTLLIARDGREMPIDDSAAPIRDSQGNLLGVVLVFRDITERRRTETHIAQLNRQLAERVQELQTLLEISPVGIALSTDPACRHIWANPVLRTLLRLPPAANASLTPAFAAEQPAYRVYRNGQAVAPDDMPMQYAMRNGITVRDVELEIVHPDGVRHTLLKSAQPLFDEGGQVRGCIAFNVDITERKAAEAALRASEERFRVAIEAAQMGFWEWDLVNDRVIWGGHYGQLLGVEPDTWRGSYADLLALVHPAEQSTVEMMVAKSLATTEPYGVAFRLVRPDGKVRWINSIGRLYGDAAGRPLRLVSTVQDISALKEAEELLQAINANLAARVRERTAEVEESRRQLEHFIGLATHDLRDTVRGIDHLTNWLNDDAGHLLPTASQRHLATLRKRVRRLEDQLEDLLTYAQADRQEDALRRVDVQALLEEIAQGLEAPPTFRFTVDLPLPVLVTQQVALEAVLRHLLDNAVKHHHQPERGQLYITTKQNKEWIEFILTDDGPGIAPQHYGLIFEMFHTLLPRDRAKGNGVGLAIVKKIVERWGGVITVESAAGQGATFRFTWPRSPRAWASPS